MDYTIFQTVQFNNKMVRLILYLFYGLIFTRISSGEFNVIRGNLGNSAESQRNGLHCVTDNVNDVLVWNTIKSSDIADEGISKSVSVPELLRNGESQTIDERKCYINNDRTECRVLFKLVDQCRLVSSAEVPMGPIFDSRWTKLNEIRVSEPSYLQINGSIKISRMFRNQRSALVVSIRGEGVAEFLLCQHSFHRREPCYLVKITESGYGITSISRCDYGIRMSLNTSGCIEEQIYTENNPANVYEWRTYVITLDTVNRTIKLYDPNKEILSYTHDNFSSTQYKQDYHFLFGSSYIRDRTSSYPSLFRFHLYYYKLISMSGVRLISEPLNIDDNGEICVTAAIGLCASCEFHFFLMYTNGQIIASKVFSGLTGPQRVQHDLPMWQRAEISAFNLGSNKELITLCMITKSKDKNGNHWAFDEITQCLPTGTVQRISMAPNGRNEDGKYIWPDVRCQKLSYGQQRLEKINPLENVTDPPAPVTQCPMSRIGPQCALECYPNCQNTSICDESGCYCSQGYHSQQCNELTELGPFGYSYIEKCQNCKRKECDISTGKCKFGCRKSLANDKYLIPPYCNDAVDFPPVPQVDEIDETTLRYYFSKYHTDQKFEITYEFEISIRLLTGSILAIKQLAESGTNVIDNMTIPIYSTVFQNLPMGSECRARVIESVQFESSDSNIAIEPIFIDGEYSNRTILCEWNTDFEIERKERSLIIKRKINDKIMIPCPDDRYNTTVIRVHSADNISQPVGSKFPMTIGNLVPNHTYIVTVRGKKSTFDYVKSVGAFKPRPSKVRALVVTFVDSNTAMFNWLPPEEPNDINGYCIALWVLYYEGCLNSTSQNTSMYMPETCHPGKMLDLTIHKLLPYIRYELTVKAFKNNVGEESSVEFTTNARKIPTAVYENLTFKNDRITWSLPADCLSITGPIVATRLFFFGVSDYVKDFRDRYDTLHNSFTLNKTKNQDIYGGEQYRVRIHALREISGRHNESAYAELNFTTDPRPPPKVRNLAIVEIDFEKKTTLLRWEKPLPPTNGEIIQYEIDTVGNFGQHGANILLPNETCPLWNDSFCKTIWNYDQIKRTIKVRAVNKDVIEGGEWSAIKDPFQETAPGPPGKVFISEKEQGMIDLTWEHPIRTGGPMKQFIIKLELISTRLVEDLQKSDRNRTILFPINKYQNLYKTQLNLLPSTRYKIDVQGVVESSVNTLIGDASSIVMETPSSLAFKYKPRYAVNNNDRVIALSLPPIVNNTFNSQVHIIVIGPKTCSDTLLVEGNLARAIELKDDEIAWIVGSFSTPPTSLLIGNENNKNDITSCPLHMGSSYVIVIVAQENDMEKPNRTKPLIWRSKLIKISAVSRFPHEAWAVPVLLLSIAIIGIIFYLVRKQKITTQINNHLVYDIPDNVSRPVTIECRASFLLRLSYDDVNKMTTDEGIYDEIKYTELVKLNKFQDYVKAAVVSGKLDEQYSLLSSCKMDPWRCRSILGRGEDDTTVVFAKRLDNSDFKLLNAFYINGYKRDRAYIALEGPESAAVVNFWHMIWQERVQVICMLSDDVGDDKTKREDYWPEIEKSMSFANITVSNVNHATFADYTFRTFHVKCDQEIRKIEHLHYTAWPDHGVPQYTQSLVTYLQKLLAIASGIGPVLIHCSVKLGRAGTIILCDICLRRAAAEGVIDVLGETEELRKQHGNMVNDKQQYILAHVILVECLLSLPTAILCDDSLPTRIHKYRNQLTLQRQRLEQSVWQDEVLQLSAQPRLELSEKNIAKNRFKDSLPMKRLYIPRYPTSDDDSSYISGVYVDSARRRNNYIASQLPLPTTVTDFWRMIAALKVELIIILQPPDIGDPTCCNFLPEPGEEIQIQSLFNIKGKSVEDGEHCSQQRMILIDNFTKSPREQPVTTLTCKGWNPGRYKPPPMPETLINLWQISEKISRSNEPTVVLCHDGVTGCGLYLTLSFLLERMGLEHECDVCFAIRAIRRSMSNFGKKQAQFEYLYNAAMLYAEHFEAYANFK